MGENSNLSEVKTAIGECHVSFFDHRHAETDNSKKPIARLKMMIFLKCILCSHIIFHYFNDRLFHYARYPHYANPLKGLYS